MSYSTHLNVASTVASTPPEREPLFPSFFGAGFECSNFIRRSGQRMDFLAETRHDQFARADYLRLQRLGFGFSREGVRWHLVEREPGKYDFSSVRPIVRAARATGTRVIWDLCHFGWPDHIDLFGPEFASSLARYGAAFARWLAEESDGPGFFVPVNEISFFSWASGDEGSMHPFATGRGYELKRQLVRAAIQAMDAIWAVRPESRFVQVDPIIHVAAHPRRPHDRDAAEAYRLSQFQAFDMLAGRVDPDLGGDERYLDIMGVNYYPQNQWIYNLKGTKRVGKFQLIRPGHHLHRPLHEMLVEIAERYPRPIFIAETGAEDKQRDPWLRHVCKETVAAMDLGVPVHGICLYPILNHPGWVDDRHCHNGLWDYPDEHGNRPIYKPLATELQRWRGVFENEQRMALRRNRSHATLEFCH